jgi:hypothetical protein
MNITMGSLVSAATVATQRFNKHVSIEVELSVGVVQRLHNVTPVQYEPV